MRKLFLLSVLFIFMENVSANFTMIEKLDEGKYEYEGKFIEVYCIADYVFVSYGMNDLTQVNKKVVLNNGSRYSVPMTCREYLKEKSKVQG